MWPLLPDGEGTSCLKGIAGSSSAFGHVCVTKAPSLQLMCPTGESLTPKEEIVGSSRNVRIAEATSLRPGRHIPKEGIVESSPARGTITARNDQEGSSTAQGRFDSLHSSAGRAPTADAQKQEVVGSKLTGDSRSAASLAGIAQRRKRRVP